MLRERSSAAFPSSTPRAGTIQERGLSVARLAVALAALAVHAAAAQGAAVTSASTAPANASWQHESWTAKDGLPVNGIVGLLQDRAGYIWAATLDGLVRFDGVRFTVFNTATFPELRNNRFVALTEGHDGSLWFGTEQLDVIRFRDGRFTSVPFEQPRSGERLRKIFVDSAGTVWVGTSRGLWVLQGEHLVAVGRDTFDAAVASIVERRDGSLWIGTIGGGIFRVARDGRVTKVPGGAALDSESIIRMYEDAAGVLWISGREGVWSYGERPVRVVSTGRLLPAGSIAQVPATGEVFAEFEGGVYRIDSHAAVLVHPRSRPSTSVVGLWADARSLWTIDGLDILRDGRRVGQFSEPRVVNAILFDREGSLWLATDGGLHRLMPGLFTTYSVAEGLANRITYPTYVDRSGAVWLGSWARTVNRIDPATGRIATFRIPVATNSFYEDDAGRLWIGAGSEQAADGGVYVCTQPAMDCRREGPPELRRSAVLALYGDANHILWAGSVGGLFRYDGRTWTRLPPSSGAPTATVRAFTQTRDGALWMGTNGGGLARYRGGAFSHVTPADGLPSDLVRALYQDADGWLWVGTEGRGLARLDPRAWPAADSAARKADRRIARIGTADGLFDEVIHQILEDDAGRLWMNTNRGVFWVARSELNAFADGKISRVHSTSYTERDGIRNREGNGGVQPAGAKGLDGRLWFPTQDGVIVVDPAKVRGDRGGPSVVIETVVAGKNTVRPTRDSATLNPDQRDLQIEYTALTFLQPANVRFRYRLEPYDASWVDAGNRRTAFYTKVPPGRYTFHVQASDIAGAWREPGKVLALRVVPRFWETLAFRWATAAALGVLLLLAFRLREARLRARALHLEHVVDERTAALRDRERELAERNEVLQSLDRAKTHFFANVSHELRAPLTLTIGPLEDLRAHTGGDPKVERWLDIALRNSRRLLRLVNQILDVAKLEAGAMRLNPRPMDLAPFTRGVVAAFAPVAERKGIRLAAETPETLVASLDPDAIEKILTNLLSNAIKFTLVGGSVTVDLSRDGDAIRLLVRDTGPGIPADRVAHVFERFYQVEGPSTRTHQGTGIGLSLVKELAELQGGRIAVESGSAGTTFITTIPTREVGVTDEKRQPVQVREDDKREDVPTLLIVDDSTDLRDYIRDRFASRFRVLEAVDGAEGISMAREHLPDVVISDLMMPGTDGHELIRALRSSPETEFLSIILLTARAEDDQRLEALERGADEYMVKPFEMRELDVRVRNLIASRRRLRERFASGRMEDEAAEPRDSETSLAPADREYLKRLRTAIQQHLADPDFGVGELAQAMSQDRSNLFRRVRQLSGESPSDLIRGIRVAEGARLLIEESGTVTDVAYAVGFNSLSYFCQCFQKVYGVTPATHRSKVLAER